MSKKGNFIRLILVIAVVGVVLFFINNFMLGSVKGVNQTIEKSELYSEKDIKKAMTIVKHQFKLEFRGCKLTDLWYEEDINISSANSWADQYNADEAIIILSNFDAGSSGGDGSLNPNDTYKDWQWILIRDKGDKSWKIKTWGY